MRILALVLTLLAIAHPLQAKDADPIQTLLDEGRQTEAFAMATRQAEQGDPKAHAWMGWFFEQAIETAQDYRKAADHYKIALKSGDNFARWRLGVLIDIGAIEGTLEEAVTLFELAAEGGDTNAMTSLAVMHATGRGTPLNYEKALADYMRAAEGRNPHGMQGVGVLLSLGQGVEKNVDEGLAWFFVSGVLGNEIGQTYFTNGIRDKTPAEEAAILARAVEIAHKFGVTLKLADEGSTALPEED